MAEEIKTTEVVIPPKEIIAQKLPNVYKKIANVQQGIKTVVKSGTNTHFNYKFATERDVVAEIKPLLGKEGLVITHSLVKEEQVSNLTKLIIKFRITNVDDKDDHIEAEAIGYGQDNQDKGAPKAYTMALKYFLSKTFLVETGDDAEVDRGGAKKGAASKGAGETGETPSQIFERAKVMIAQTRNVDGLMEYADNVSKSKTFTKMQKDELQKLLKTRVDVLLSDNQEHPKTP